MILNVLKTIIIVKLLVMDNMAAVKILVSYRGIIHQTIDN